MKIGDKVKVIDKSIAGFFNHIGTVTSIRDSKVRVTFNEYEPVSPWLDATSEFEFRKYELSVFVDL